MTSLLFDKKCNMPVLLLTTIFGRLPIWVLLLALSSEMLHPKAFVCLYTLLLCSRAYLMWYETGSGGPKLLIKTLWKHFFRWIVYYVILEIALFAVFYTAFLGSRFDHALLLMAFGLYIPVIVLQIFIPPVVKPQRNTSLKRTFPMPLALVLLWLYVVISGEASLFKYMALIVIYTLEFFAVYEPIIPADKEEEAVETADELEGGVSS